ncbi:uncharacterized protein LOC133645743 isoform X1 [Entelurus aequoreus]|uniref:uncharacterized protein LOC133645743 isoform X1 n=1 Tax=Entelurus aequoreus TaxID=161455 RepID=UPI002B1E0B37|nr:uncharacterized protein LOC133645743 isoform X1 [Entelurus aequoreus]XP_061896591.1 uncharacterized protein LOC133645743 isoform X1 [Entelurus aequoreus]XP_061896592.1 uncharacterized protein LOC133645743 isoform X1 [Entelurus aequoreus]XP_061896593.1 uncharacterized protein LOC133645743 isoform X1 [Entelurus aequoreus]
MAPSFVVVEFLGERSVAVVPTIWTEDDGKNTFCYWPRPNPTHSTIRKAEIPDKQFWERLPIRVFRKTLTASTRPLQPVPANTRPLQGIQADLTAQRELQHFQAQSRQECIQLKPVPDRSSQYQTTPASTSQYQTAPRTSRNALDSELFQLNMKVQNILENQGEIMHMLRGLAAQSVGPESVDVQDLIDQPFETLEQLKAFCERLDTDLLLRKQLVKALTALGGQNLADTVRTMLRKIATNKVLEQLGLRGKSGKVAFENLPLYRIINKACRGVYKQTTTAEVDCELGEVLKLATFRKGGSKFERRN